MRTTIEISDQHRAKLLEIAAKRRLKGFSPIVQEAIEKYLGENPPPEEKLQNALSVLGTLGNDEADAIEASINKIRNKWR